MQGKLLTPEEVAERLAVSPKSVREWLRSGKLKGIKLGKLWRVRESTLEDFILQAEKESKHENDNL